MENLLKKLRRDFSNVTFVSGKDFSWSPKRQEVIYTVDTTDERAAAWSLLHEVGHAVLEHDTYDLDLDLLQLEIDAWQKAKEIGKVYGYEIEESHIEDCMDTYRDWLHRRSACPTCSSRSFQRDSRHYQCFNCKTAWSVTASRFCRPYRRLAPSNAKS